MLSKLKRLFQGKKAIIWYLVEKEGMFFMLGLVVGLVVGILMIKDIIPVSSFVTLCATGGT